MEISGKGIWKAIRITVMALAIAAPILSAETIYAGSWEERNPYLLGDSVGWNSVAVSRDGSTVAACSYYFDPTWRQYERCFVYIYSDIAEDGGSGWRRRDPAGSWGFKYLSAVAVDDSGGRLAVCVDDGYIYTSTDGGAVWAKREPAGLGVPKRWAQVSISADGGKMAACAGESDYIYISSDGGENWSACSSAGTAQWSRVAWGAHGTQVAASNDRFIYTSADGGATWAKREPAGPGAEKSWSSIASSADGSILLACESGGSLWTTADGGASWTERDPDGPGKEKTWREVSISSDGSKMMACADSDFIYLSYDGGASWAKPDPVGEGTGSGWHSVAVSGDSLFLAAGGDSGNLYTRSITYDVATPFFTTQYLLPQTLNRENLSRFLAMEHKEYHLDGWFFMGQLIEGGETPPDKDQISAFAFSVQRKDMTEIPGTPIRLSVFPSIVAFQGSRHYGYLFGGGLDTSQQVTVTSDPWSVVAVTYGYSSIMSMSLVSGEMGMKGAVYHLAADVVDQGGEHRLQTDVWIRDVFGIINDGYGPASFFPQWILPGQREKILSTYGGSLEAYIFAENDPMVCQGDYYYSAPRLEVLDFRITRDYTEVLAEGSRGKLWLDYVVASYDDRAADMLKDCGWQFFAIQFDERDASLLVLNTETSTTGTLPVARLYLEGEKSRNGAINATYSWDIDKIIITPDPDSQWPSPITGIKYYTKYRIELRSNNPVMNADLTVTMLRNNSEIYIPGQNPAYEGVGIVSGRFGLEAVSGYAFVEFEQTYLDRTARPPWINDYNGDGTSDIAVYRAGSGFWDIRGITRVYFGSDADHPVPGDYDGDGTTDIGIFRPATGLWAIRALTRTYFGTSSDDPVPGDYDGEGTADIGIFRESTGLWTIKDVTRCYFGSAGDVPVPGYYRGRTAKDIGIYREASGLWAIKGWSRVYLGSTGDETVPGDYDGDGTWEPGIFRPSTGRWEIGGLTRVYYGSSADRAVPADYNGDGLDDTGIFRASTGLWGIRNFSRAYFGATGDIPVTR